jgi:hypothetical protein
MPDSHSSDLLHEFVAFAGVARLATGSLAEAAAAAWRAQDAGLEGPILVFSRSTGALVDVDLRGAEQEVVARYLPAPESPPKRGRPSLGVVPREVTLLPRHWDWLAHQPGGASATLRRLVDTARKADTVLKRERTEAAYRFMSAIGGDLVAFEEVARALFAEDRNRLEHLLQPWPPQVRQELVRLLDGRSAQGEAR